MLPHEHTSRNVSIATSHPQRRLRALGILSSLGATDRNVRLVMLANGAVVGTALVDALKNSLDAEGRATAKTVTAVAELTASLAEGVRGARAAAE